jgi:hypothetical protein
MGLELQPGNVLERIKELERRVTAIYKKVGIASAVIRQGGLTLLDDAFLRMVDDNGTEIVYFGPDDQGRQIIRIRREGGSDVMWTGFTGAGNQFWRLTDRFGNRELFSDDTENGGIARPWLSVPMYVLYSMSASSVYGYMNIAATSIGSETVLWEGRIPLVSHPRLAISGVWGQASGSNSATYRLKLNSTQVGTWSTGGLENSEKGAFDIDGYLDQTNVVVQLTVQASGSGQVGAHVFGCWLRQT